MSMNIGGNKRAISEINVTPLVDVMLVLLVVFMVTTPIIVEETKRAVDIDLPLAAGTNRSDVEPFVGTKHPPRHDHWERHSGTGHGSRLEKSTTTNRGNLGICHN